MRNKKLNTGKERILTKNRIMEYFTIDGLVKMTGIESDKFDIYILKELIDNALDACELTDKPPNISIEINSDLFLKGQECEYAKEGIIHIKVKDEGPGISKEILKEITNFQRFGGTKYFVKKPSRGAQGNALMTILGIPAILAIELGEETPSIKITTKRWIHIWKIKINKVLEKIEVEKKTRRVNFTRGTCIEIALPWNVWIEEKRYNKVIESFAMWNPHTRIEYQCNGKKRIFERSIQKIDKYSRAGFGSVHWYTLDDFENLLYANIRYMERKRVKETIIDFAKHFKGGSSNQKTFTQSFAKDLPKYINQIQKKSISKKLFLALKESTSPPKSSIIGSIGKKHFFNVINRYKAIEKLFKYKKFPVFFPGTDIPYCLEVAVGTTEKLEERKVFFGINNTITYHLPFERDLFYPSNVNERDNPWQRLTGISDVLSAYRISSNAPVMIIMHLTTPNIRYENYGKSTFETGGFRE